MAWIDQLQYHTSSVWKASTWYQVHVEFNIAMISFNNFVPFSTFAVLTMVLFLDFPNALYSTPDDDIDLDEIHTVSFLADNDGMDEQGGHGNMCSIRDRNSVTAIEGLCCLRHCRQSQITVLSSCRA
jgi:hypothetical protein